MKGCLNKRGLDVRQARRVEHDRSVWCNDEIKAAVRRKEAAWKRGLAASDEETKERCMEPYREEKR